MSVRRSLIVLLVAAIAIPAIITFNNLNQTVGAQMAAQTRLENLQTYNVQRGSVEAVVSASGEMEADELIELSFTSGGRIAEIFVEEGDYVQAGEPIARLDNDAEQIAFHQATLELQNAELELEDLLGPVDPDDVRVAQANVDAAWGEYRDTLASASSDDVREAELEYAQAQQSVIDAERARQIAGGLSEEEFTLLEAQIGEASFNAEIARLQLQDLQNGNGGNSASALAAVETAERELERVLAGADPDDVEIARVAVTQAQAGVEQAEDEYSRTLITAPREGLISQVDIERGQLVSAAEPVVILADITPLGLSVEVDETDIALIDIRMPARIRLDALPDVELPAQVADLSLVGDEEDGVVTYDAEVTLNQADERVLVGMTADAIIAVETRENVIVVPNDYIRFDGGRAYVDVLQADSSLQEVEIGLGLQGETSSEVVNGLQEGDTVAIDLSGGRFQFFGGGQ
jgi:HlyD family secretion protein